jgi:hypothetical protein
MAIRRQKLHHRIKGQPQAAADAYKGTPNPQPSAPSQSVGLPTPPPSSSDTTGTGNGHPVVAAPMTLPLAMVRTQPVDSNYVTLSMEDLAPITTADGAMVAATGPGHWDQLYQAGR